MVARVPRTEVLHDAFQLSAGDRAELAADLLASLDGPTDRDASTAWTDEIRRRVDGALAGEDNGTPWPSSATSCGVAGARDPGHGRRCRLISIAVGQ
jgi:hypothetical protein